VEDGAAIAEGGLDGGTMLLRRGCERGAFAVVGAIGPASPVADGLDWDVECAEEKEEEEGEEGEEGEDMEMN